MREKIAVILVSLCLLGMPLMADEIRLNNGELVTGNIVELGEENLRIATVSGDVFIPRKKVESAFLGLETSSLLPRGKKAMETSLKDPTPAPDIGAPGGDFLEE